MLRRCTEQYIMQTVVHAGQLPAGNVYAFPTKQHQTVLPLPANLQYQKLIDFEVLGESFADEDLHSGDTIVARLSFEKTEVTAGRLVVVRLPSNIEVLKRIYFKDKKVILKASNPAFNDLTFDASEIEVVALVECKIVPLK